MSKVCHYWSCSYLGHVRRYLGNRSFTPHEVRPTRFRHVQTFCWRSVLSLVKPDRIRRLLAVIEAVARHTTHFLLIIVTTHSRRTAAGSKAAYFVRCTSPPPVPPTGSHPTSLFGTWGGTTAPWGLGHSPLLCGGSPTRAGHIAFGALRPLGQG